MSSEKLSPTERIISVSRSAIDYSIASQWTPEAQDFFHSGLVTIIHLLADLRNGEINKVQFRYDLEQISEHLLETPQRILSQALREEFKLHPVTTAKTVTATLERSVKMLQGNFQTVEEMNLYRSRARDTGKYSIAPGTQRHSGHPSVGKTIPHS